LFDSAEAELNAIKGDDEVSMTVDGEDGFMTAMDSQLDISQSSDGMKDGTNTNQEEEEEVEASIVETDDDGHDVITDKSTLDDHHPEIDEIGPVHDSTDEMSGVHSGMIIKDTESTASITILSDDEHSLQDDSTQSVKQQEEEEVQPDKQVVIGNNTEDNTEDNDVAVATLPEVKVKEKKRVTFFIEEDNKDDENIKDDKDVQEGKVENDKVDTVREDTKKPAMRSCCVIC
jgi:hypothetical protein